MHESIHTNKWWLPTVSGRIWVLEKDDRYSLFYTSLHKRKKFVISLHFFHNEKELKNLTHI